MTLTTETHPPDEHGEARVGAKLVEGRSNVQPYKVGGAELDGVFQPAKGLVVRPTCRFLRSPRAQAANPFPRSTG